MTATLLLTTPNSLTPALAHHIVAPTRENFTRQVTSKIRMFAARRGISARAVEYEIVRGRKGAR